jgi:hypothetical protein
MYVVRIRRGTESEWAYENPVLLEGELGYELDSNRFKVGDGVKHWIDLPYGAEGPAGPPGPTGPSVNIKGVVPTYADLPGTALIGEVYITKDTNDGWIRQAGNTWANLGPLKGADGAKGDKGDKGDTGVGEKGDKGDKGDTGASGIWWYGTQAEYNAIPVKDPGTLYVVRG